jgi:hypothetical protein
LTRVKPQIRAPTDPLISIKPPRLLRDGFLALRQHALPGLDPQSPRATRRELTGRVWLGCVRRYAQTKNGRAGIRPAVLSGPGSAGACVAPT